jgi:hypothetical protein
MAKFQRSELRHSLLDLIQPKHFVNGNNGVGFIYLEEVISIAHAFLFRMIFANPVILKIVALWQSSTRQVAKAFRGKRTLIPFRLIL